MKYLPLTLIALLVTGCASNPRVGDESGADYFVTPVEDSSEALRVLSETPIKGVRDLTKEEFESNKKDLEVYKLMTSLNTDNGSNANAYALSSVAVGTTLGLTMSYASGLAIIGRIGADDRARNYDFSNDFQSKALIYSPMGSSELMDYFMNKMPLAMNGFEQDMVDSYSIKAPVNPKHSLGQSDEKYNKRKKDYYKYVGITNAPKDKVEGATLTQYVFAIYCGEFKENAVCEIVAKVKIGANDHPSVSLLIKKVSNLLPEGSLMYMPPRKDVFQLPMVYSGQGEPMLLIETQI